MDFEQIRHLEQLPEEELAERILKIRKEQGKNVCLLAHLYQRKKITELADFVGDSYGLSKSAAQFEGGKYIVFAGVRFMAESARILARPEQEVLHPDPEAGCPMADMASLPQVLQAWDFLKIGKKTTPITYMNSTADIKAFCGENEGTICTSSNALKTFEWAFKKSDRVFFLPDEHLGRNTALKFGISPEDIAIWDPEKENGVDPESYGDAKVVLWRGYCPVHMKFTVRDIDHVRKFYPKAKIIVHPECTSDVVERADYVGSTDFIRTYVAKETKPGDQIFIGTEVNLIQNLSAQYPDRLISKLHRSLCLTMYQINLGRILYTLENLDTFERVEIPASVQYHAKVALERMLSLQG
ncbi:MAG: quinolinate synthase NadA [Proteobacteria bacterium]|nr:quinolinate synthase NadA [Pseudomonadota bacterium]